MSKKLELTRRRVLAGIGTIGAAGATAGLGTSAYFNDEESFNNNSIEAGELNLVVDWYTDQQQGSAGTSSASGTMDGDDEYSYTVTDAKPGDSGTLAFCPKIIDNPAWLWVGSDSGLTNYDGGGTEPEMEVDNSTGGSLGDPFTGAGEGELSDNIQVDVSYAGSVEMSDGEVVCIDTIPMNNPEDYTLTELATDLESGFILDHDRETEGAQPYPASPDVETQTGPCLCIDWEIPTGVGNIIQSDAVELGFSFHAEQSRHNDSGATDSPFNSTS